MFKDSSNQAEFELLIRATRHVLFHFIIVQYQHLDLVRTVKNDLKAKYPERPFAEFNLENINPETFIHSILACKTGFVFIEKFELFFQEDLQALAIGFNQRRYLFSTLPIQLIVFVPLGGDTLLHFQKTMPDFYSILNLSISLKSENLPAENLQSKISFDNTNNDYDSVEEAKKEITRIEKRLQTLEDRSENAVLKRQLISQLANAYRFCGDYLKSKELYELLLVELEQQNKPNVETEITATQHNLAFIYRDLGDYMKAKELLEKTLIFDRKHFGTEHPNTILSYLNLAIIHRDLKDYQKAKKLAKKALILNEKHLGEEHPNTSISYTNLGLVLRDLGNFVEAKELLDKALISNRKNFGEEHSNTARSYSNLATVFHILKDYQSAKELLEKALIIDEKIFGEEHPSTAITYSNLALSLQSLGDYVGAKKLLEKTLIIDEIFLGKEHPSTAITYSNLALSLQDLGDYVEAKKLLEKTLDVNKKTFGERHPITVGSYLTLAKVLQDLGDYDQAITLLEKAYQIIQNILGEQDPNTKIVKENLDLAKHQYHQLIINK